MDDSSQEVNEIEVVETRVVKRITLGRIFSSILEAFNLERGGFFTLKALLVNPGRTVADYLGQNRYYYTPPFRILLITTAIALYIVSVSNMSNDFSEGFLINTSNEMNEKIILNKMFEFFSAYGNLMLWTFIPIAALFSYLFNRKGKYNYAEHLVFQTYLFCIANIITIIIPLAEHTSVEAGYLLIFALMMFYYTYAYKVFLNRSLIKTIWDNGWIWFLATAIWSFLFMGGFMIFVINNRELFEP